MEQSANRANARMTWTAGLSALCIIGFVGIGISQAVAAKRFQVRGPGPVDLRTASNYVILTKTGITTTGATEVVGNIGVSPIGSTAITGFGLVLSRDGRFSTSSLVTGRVYAANYASPTPAQLTRAIGDMQRAYADAAGRTTPAPIKLPTEIGGLTLAAGLYRASTSVGISRNVTLKGGPNDVWIFQIAQKLTEGSGAKVILAGGARANNVFWQVAGVVAIGTTADMEGEILAKTGITLKNAAVANGRLLAQTNVTLIGDDVTQK